MHLKKLIFGEILLLLASVLVFRSLWLMLDEYFGDSNLPLMLTIGIATSILALLILNSEVNRK
ncbi:MAG: hypothetical protein ACM3JE_03840 [Betaproteobacteria bacterium]